MKTQHIFSKNQDEGGKPTTLNSRLVLAALFAFVISAAGLFGQLPQFDPLSNLYPECNRVRGCLCGAHGQPDCGEMYNPCNISLSLGPNRTVQLGYGPLQCTTLGVVSISGHTAPLSYLWSTGATTATITVCPTLQSTYSLIVTDASGCTAASSLIVCVEDVRCGNRLDKISVCHVPPGNPGNSQQLCIAASAVTSHLSHPGDRVGSCTPPACPAAPKLTADEAESLEPMLIAFPNPFRNQTTVQFRVGETAEVRIRVFDAMGREVSMLFDGTAKKGETVEMIFRTDNLPSGIYQLRLENEIANSMELRLILMR